MINDLEQATVNARDEQWPRAALVRPDYKYRLWFANMHSFYTGMQTGLILTIMREFGGEEHRDFFIEDAPNDMADMWNSGKSKTREAKEMEKYGNSLFLTEDGLAVVKKVLANGKHADFDETFKTLTLLETRE